MPWEEKAALFQKILQEAPVEATIKAYLSSSGFWQLLALPQSKAIDACLGGRGWLDPAGCACMLHVKRPPSASQNPVNSTVA
jgi:hypothetical protein